MASKSTSSPQTRPAQTPSAQDRSVTQADGDKEAETGSKSQAGKSETGRADDSKSAASAGKAESASKSGSKGQARDGEAVAMLKQDHRAVEALFKEYESAGKSRKEAIIVEVCKALTLHTMLEEEIFYPACRDATSDDDALDEAQVEHDSAKLLIADLMHGDRNDPFRDAKVKVLSEQILHHVKEEEGADGIFAEARAKGVDTPELAAQLKKRRGDLEAGDRLPPPAPVSFGAFPRASAHNTQQERTMASYQNRSDNRDRDDRGRFSGQGGRYSEDDDWRHAGRSQDRPRDEDGRFMSDDRGGRSGGRGRDDEDRGYRSSSSSSNGGGRGRDDDDRGGRSSGGGREGGRGQGGWFGDSEGHSEASRRGWDNSDHRGSGWYGDSRGHSEASRRGWENSDHEGSGWYGDSRGHSEASRRGWQNSDHEGSGWYGDSRGHSEASRRGWENSDHGRGRSRDDDDDRGGRARMSRDHDYDDRGSSGGRGGRGSEGRGSGGGNQGHGGWFGDSRGHSEASRRGWENRH